MTDKLAEAIDGIGIYLDDTVDKSPALNGKIQGWQYDHFHCCLRETYEAAKKYQQIEGLLDRMRVDPKDDFILKWGKKKIKIWNECIDHLATTGAISGWRDTDSLIAKLQGDCLDFICECIGAPKEYNDGKAAMRDFIFRKLVEYLPTPPSNKGDE